MTPAAESFPLTETGRRLAHLVVELLTDKLELASLELREAKIRLIQAVLMALVAAVLLVVAVALAVVAALLVMPPQWRPIASGAGAGLCLLLGLLVLHALRRRLARNPLPFEQTVAELKKDRACF